MLKIKALATLTLLGLTLVFAQTPPAQNGPPAGRGGRGGGGGGGGFVPGQQRPPGDPAEIERGKTLYGISCTGCHGADLRGGDMGGPNLLRSQLALSDQNGELIRPILQGSRQSTGMPAIPLSPDDAKAVITYLHTMMASIGRQGMPPSVGMAAPSILVGDAAAGKTYFAAKCASCHSATGDLQGLATRIPDPKTIQNTFIAGGGGRGRGRGGAAPEASSRRTVTVTVTPATGLAVEGRLLRIDDFLVTVGMEDGASRTFRREGNNPKVDVHDPMKGHRDLLSIYTDKDMHDLTAYLVTLK